MGYTVVGLADRLRSEADAYELVEELRWGKGKVQCPHCHSDEATFLRPANGVSRKTRTGALSQRRVWKCRGCKRQFSAITGTVFHSTKVPLRIVLLVIFEMTSSKNGIAAREVERKYGLCPRTAWFLMHRVREAMRDDGLAMFDGVVVADETFIGGKFKNRHKNKREKFSAGRAGGPYDKTPVLSLIDDDTGQVRSRVLPRVDGSNLRKAIAEQVNLASSVLHTDKSSSYNVVAKEVAAHHAVDHQADEYVRWELHGIVSTNKAENFFGQLKRSIDGTHHRVSIEHLPRYLAEFDFRYNTRKLTDTARMHELMNRTSGRRITYKRVSNAAVTQSRAS